MVATLLAAYSISKAQGLEATSEVQVQVWEYCIAL